MSTRITPASSHYDDVSLGSLRDDAQIFILDENQRLTSRNTLANSRTSLNRVDSFPVLHKTYLKPKTYKSTKNVKIIDDPPTISQTRSQPYFLSTNLTENNNIKYAEPSTSPSEVASTNPDLIPNPQPKLPPRPPNPPKIHKPPEINRPKVNKTRPSPSPTPISDLWKLPQNQNNNQQNLPLLRHVPLTQTDKPQNSKPIAKFQQRKCDKPQT